MTARDEILASIRSNLAEARREIGIAPHAEHHGTEPGTPTGLGRAADRVLRFRERLESVGGQVSVVSGVPEAAARVAEIAGELGARKVALSDSPEVARVAEELATCELLRPGCEREELMQADLGITSARFGIAETGTLVLVSGLEKNRLASLVPTVHVALLPASAIVSGLGEALAEAEREVRAGTGGAITLITGPSRTADIELTLVVGVHGPKELYVVILDAD